MAFKTEVASLRAHVDHLDPRNSAVRRYEYVRKPAERHILLAGHDASSQLSFSLRPACSSLLADGKENDRERRLDALVKQPAGERVGHAEAPR